MLPALPMTIWAYLRTIIIICQSIVCRWHLGKETLQHPSKYQLQCYGMCHHIFHIFQNVQSIFHRIPAYSQLLVSFWANGTILCSGGRKVKGPFPKTLYSSLVLRWGGVCFFSPTAPSHSKSSSEFGTQTQIQGMSKTQWWLAYCRCTTIELQNTWPTHTIVFQ